MDGIIEHNTTDPSVRRKCWELMVKPQAAKLKNTAISFWCFLTVLISHATTMGWMDLCEFVVNSSTINLFKTFALVPLEMIVNRMSAMRISAANPPAATRTTTGGDANASPGPTAAQIGTFKSKGIFNYILNSCDEELQVWIGNNLNKINDCGLTLFKMLSSKIVQCTRASIRLARTSLHTITLKNYNNNVEKLVNDMENKIKILSVGGEQPNSIFADIFRIFSKADNAEFRSMVHQYSRLYDEGVEYESDWMLNVFVTKYKQLVLEGDWKDEDKESTFVAMLQQVQKENAFLKDYVMNLAKTSGPTQNGYQGQPNGSNGSVPNDNAWKRKNEGPTKSVRGKLFTWCPHHKMYAVHKPSDCYLNPSHPQYEEKKKAREEHLNSNGNNKRTLEMNLMNTDDYVPINPWITLAATNVQFSENLPEISPAIDSIFSNDNRSSDVVLDHEIESQDSSKDDTNVPCGPHTSFWGHRS